MPQADDPRHNLRLPPELKARLAHAAIDGGRSMNAEILARLEKSFEPEPLREIESLLRVMSKLSDSERSQVVDRLAEIAAMLSRA